VELEKREISKEYQQSVIDKWFEEKILEIAYQKQLLLNETERYTWGEMLGILFASPFIMAGRWYFELSLPELKRQNFKKKFKQRLILLIIGPFLWFFIITNFTSSNSDELIKEAEQIDISEWKKMFLAAIVIV